MIQRHVLLKIELKCSLSDSFVASMMSVSGAVARRTFRLLNSKKALAPAIHASQRNAHFQFVPSTPDPSLGVFSTFKPTSFTNSALLQVQLRR